MALQDVITNRLKQADPQLDPSRGAIINQLLAHLIGRASNNVASTVPTTSPPPSPQATPVQVAQQLNQDPYYGLSQVRPQGAISDTVLAASKKTGISPALLAAVLWNESGYNPKAINGEDRGIAQINKRAFPNVSDEQAYDPNFAIPFMADTLKGYIDKRQNLAQAVAAYNVGLGRTGVDSSRPTGLGPKGQAYIQRVSRNLDQDYAKQLGL